MTSLTIDFSLEEDRLKVRTSEGREAGRVLDYYDYIDFSAEETKRLCQEFISLLNKTTRRGRLDRSFLDHLQSVGQDLYDNLVPLSVKERLQHKEETDLILHIEDKLVHIPWELLFDGEHFLCRRFNVGRMVTTRQYTARFPTRKTDLPLSMLILCDPKGDLPAASQEGKLIRNTLDLHIDKVHIAWKTRDVRPDYIRRTIRDFDIVHYAGHATYKADDPSQSGWMVKDGTITAALLVKMQGIKPLPSLVFSNACQSSEIQEWQFDERSEQTIFGLANAFLSAGVQHYIGTFWNILDEPGAHFAHAFYEALIQGGPVGKSMRVARDQVAKRYGEENIVWASYLLYGDPGFSYFPAIEGKIEHKASREVAIEEPRSEMSIEPRTPLGPPDITVGQTISHFRILKKLSAEGAQGIVYKAEDTRIRGRTVALKFLSPTLIYNSEAIERLRREAEAVACLDHPNIVTLHEFDEIEGTPFISMQYIEGETLKERIRRGPPSEEESIRIGIEVASALRCAHDHGIIHCDIKPANIMLTDDNKVKLTDFGIAKIEQRTSIGDIGQIKGTIAYMPPEITKGQEPTPLCDIFSLGVVLYELTTGERPFQSKYIPSLLHAIVNNRERPIREIRPEVTETLETIIAKMMAKAPEDRYQSASDLEWELRQSASHVEGATVSVPPESQGGQDSATETDALEPVEISEQSGIRRIFGWLNESPNSLWKYSFLGILTFLLGFGLIFSLLKTGGEKEIPLVDHDVSPSIAVMFLKSFSESDGDDAFADGLTQDIIDGLSHIGSIRVAPRMAVLPFKGRAVSPEEIKQELQVNYVLGGSIQKSVDRVRISVELVSTETGRQVWSKRYNKEMNLQDIFAIQDEITEMVVSAMEGQITTQEKRRLRSRPTNSLNAYELFLLGRENLLDNQYQEATDLFNKALEVDDSYAMAYVGLAASYILQYDKGLVPDKGLIDQAVDLCNKALDIAPELAEANQVLALAYSLGKYDYLNAIEYNLRAIEIRPGYFRAYYTLGNSYQKMGQYKKAREMFQKSIDLYDQDHDAWRGIGTIYLYQEQYKKALLSFERACICNPKEPINQLYRGWTYMEIGKETEGAKILKNQIERDPTKIWPYDFLARYYLIRRLFSEAKPLYDKIIDLAPEHPLALINTGLFYSISGDYKRARELYDRAIEIVPDHAGAHLQLCSLDYQSGNLQEALSRSRNLVSQFSEKFESWLARGQLLLFSGRVDEAYKLSEEMITRFPDDPVSLDFHGRVLLRRGDLREAESLSRRMIAEFDESPRGYNLLAAALVRLDRLEEAYEVQHNGMEQDPNDPETLWCTVQVATMAGHLEEAEKWNARLAEMDLDRFIETAPIGQRWDKLFWLREGMELYLKSASHLSQT